MTARLLTPEELEEIEDRLDHWRAPQDRRALLSHIAALTEAAPSCAFCGSTFATCIGRYEGDPATTFAFACGACCGHGNEDGGCIPLEDVPAQLAAVTAERDRFAEALDIANATTLRAREEGRAEGRRKGLELAWRTALTTADVHVATACDAAWQRAARCVATKIRADITPAAPPPEGTPAPAPPVDATPRKDHP